MCERKTFADKLKKNLCFIPPDCSMKNRIIPILITLLKIRSSIWKNDSITYMYDLIV